MNFKTHIKSQVQRAKSELKLPEYTAWWIMRIMMIIAFFGTFFSDRGYMVWVMIAANFAAMFSVPILSLIFPQSLFLGRIPFRVQTFLDVFVIAGSFFGHYINIYRYEGIYDKALHVVSGFLTVYIGCEIIKALSPVKKVSKKVEIFSAFSFSYVVMVLWEMFEFVSDYILGNANNQAYMQSFCDSVYTDNYFFFVLFGRGNAGPEQLPILDTMIDLVAAVVGSFLALAVLIITAKIKKKKAETQKEEITV